MKKKIIGVLAFQGDVHEHAVALEAAARRLKIPLGIIFVRTKKDAALVSALIIPGGESTTLQKLCEREGMFEDLKRIPSIFGTCAGAILLARSAGGSARGQKTLGLMDIAVDRNAYGRQVASFEENLETDLGRVPATFIRAPRILKTGKGVTVLARKNGDVLACEERKKDSYYLAACFHPELTTTIFHEHFLKNLA